MWSAKLIMMNLGKAVLVLGTLRLQSLGAVRCGVRSIDVKEKYIKPTRVFELEDGVGIYRNRRR